MTTEQEMIKSALIYDACSFVNKEGFSVLMIVSSAN